MQRAMESGDIGGKSLKNGENHVCQICGDNVGCTEKGQVFIACDVCAFPVCRPCYEYEIKDGNQSCPQCKTRYKQQKGSPTILRDKEENANADDITAEFHVTETQNEKQKIAQRMLNWHMTYGRGEDTRVSNYDKEGPHNHIPFLISGQEVSGEFSTASSPPRGGRTHWLPYSGDVNQSWLGTSQGSLEA